MTCRAERRRPADAAPNVAVVLAGGVGARVGMDIPKQLLKIAGHTILEHTLKVFEAHPDVDEVVVMMAPGHLDAVRAIVRDGGYDKVRHILEGAESRNGTTDRALEVVGPDAAKVLFHDAVRPLVSARIISECFAALERVRRRRRRHPLGRHDHRGRRGQRHPRHPAARPPAPRADPAGLPRRHHPRGLREGPRRPRLRRDRRLRRGAALPAGHAHLGGRRRGAQHEGHRPDRRLHRRQALPAQLRQPRSRAHAGGVRRGAGRPHHGRLRRQLRHRRRHPRARPRGTARRCSGSAAPPPAPTSSGGPTCARPRSR